MSDCSLIATRNSHAKHNQLVGRIPRIAEVRQRRLAHQRHEMLSERRPKNCKYWNLHPVVMLDYPSIATRNSHAKHNKSVCRKPEVRQRILAHQRNEMSSEKRQKNSNIGTYTL